MQTLQTLFNYSCTSQNVASFSARLMEVVAWCPFKENAFRNLSRSIYPWAKFEFSAIKVKVSKASVYIGSRLLLLAENCELLFWNRPFFFSSWVSTSLKVYKLTYKADGKRCRLMKWEYLHRMWCCCNVCVIAGSLDQITASSYTAYVKRIFSNVWRTRKRQCLVLACFDIDPACWLAGWLARLLLHSRTRPLEKSA
jgi:hypothetical protein